MVNKLKVSMLLLAVLGNLAWSSSAKAAFKGNLTIEIDGFKNTQGQVCASIFAQSEGFPNKRDRVLQRQCTKITDKTVKITFENLTAGSYAIAAMHDQNEDLKLNRNTLGMPTEGFGFSRNPEVRTSAPPFSDAAVLLAGPNTSIQIHLKYL
ncbi:MAG: DUF2141 domain-containing protein [Mojavia pulchra JT2-VF2]|jgi:uncharacterized protein (DUF2141 family)|uniref:DUF2141 domain-containing protein n=1 Tax=Mojavia pulchra JT2-VF2 TaxID=287848 RepID=A0A951PW10_9NOST|nr:DUF2141 domain-containing protein [Mojavia pulchra JT2-VF2]